MVAERSRKSIAPLLVFLSLSWVTSAQAQVALSCADLDPQASPVASPAERLLRWNRIANNASGMDHGLAQPEQGGPGRASRAMAIVHIALFEAVNAITPRFESYTNLMPVMTLPPAVHAAIVQ